MPNQYASPVWRSLLFVPANVDRFIDKAHERGADGIILDLEDSVIAAEKPAARAALERAIPQVGQAGADVLVRINAPWRLAVRDIEAAVRPGLKALVLPKVIDAGHLRIADEIVSEVEAEAGLPAGAIGFSALLETPDAVLNAREIAAASPRLRAMSVGGEDFALEMGMLPEPDGLYPAAMQIALAARAAGVLPMGGVGSIAGFGDLELYRAQIERAKALGFAGAACIHPAQVAVLNDVFGVTEEEVAEARRIVAAFEEAAAAGLGAVQLDGKMIDIPVVERARRLIARHAAIAAKISRQGP